MTNKKQLDGMYKVLSEAYKGNWQYRWHDTPYLKDAIESGKVESIAGHVWGTMQFWFYLKRLCPNLDSLVDTIEIYEILLNHDLGETNSGDIPLYRKVHGESDNREGQREDLKFISNGLPETRNKLLKWFDEFEQSIESIDRLEVLVSKWIDNMQGNHFALTFGKNLPKYSKAINGILQMRFVVYTNRLIDVLRSGNQTEAVSEVKEVAQHHAEQIKKAGIDFDTSKLKI